jgi:hypothetical protein
MARHGSNDKKSLKIKMLEQALIEKVYQLFRKLALSAPSLSRGKRRGILLTRPADRKKRYRSIVQWKWTLCAAKKAPPGGAGA